MSMPHASFGNLVVRVGLVIAKEEMSGIAARRIIAAVQNVSPQRNGATMHHP
jgi:hypothetical protein